MCPPLNRLRIWCHHEQALYLFPAQTFGPGLLLGKSFFVAVCKSLERPLFLWLRSGKNLKGEKADGAIFPGGMRKGGGPLRKMASSGGEERHGVPEEIICTIGVAYI